MSATTLGRGARHARKRYSRWSVSSLRSRVSYWLWRQVDGLIGPLTPAKYRAFWIIAPLAVIALAGAAWGGASGFDWVNTVMTNLPHAPQVPAPTIGG